MVLPSTAAERPCPWELITTSESGDDVTMSLIASATDSSVITMVHGAVEVSKTVELAVQRSLGAGQPWVCSNGDHLELAADGCCKPPRHWERIE